MDPLTRPDPATPVDAAHRQALRAVWEALGSPFLFPLDGSIGDIEALDYFLYEGLLDRLPTDDYRTVSSAWADVVIRQLRFRPLWLPMGSDRLLALRHDESETVIMPWPRVYEAMRTEWPQFGRLAYAYLGVVLALMDSPGAVTHPIHPVADILWLDPSPYPPRVVELVKSVHRRLGNRMVLSLELEPYYWGKDIDWAGASLTLVAMLERHPS